MRRSNGVTAMARDAQRLPRPVEQWALVPFQFLVRYGGLVVGSLDRLIACFVRFVCLVALFGLSVFARPRRCGVLLGPCVCAARTAVSVDGDSELNSSAATSAAVGRSQSTRRCREVLCGAVPFRSMQRPWPCRGRAVGVTAATVPGRHCRRCRCAVAFCALAVGVSSELVRPQAKPTRAEPY
jgi:hypothetical protein